MKIILHLYIDSNIQSIKTVDERQDFLNILKKSKFTNSALIIAD